MIYILIVLFTLFLQPSDPEILVTVYNYYDVNNNEVLDGIDFVSITPVYYEIESTPNVIDESGYLFPNEEGAIQFYLLANEKIRLILVGNCQRKAAYPTETEWTALWDYDTCHKVYLTDIRNR